MRGRCPQKMRELLPCVDDVRKKCDDSCVHNDYNRKNPKEGRVVWNSTLFRRLL